ncbi:MAG: hypothetical protein HY908_24060 [Myxococcales bacterium]|nr:hypothetical protein [Myxococcales bacterium]
MTISVKCKVKNATTYPLKLRWHGVPYGIVSPSFPSSIEPGTTATWTAESNATFCGTEGWVGYELLGDTDHTYFAVYWDKPFIASNAYKQERAPMETLADGTRGFPMPERWTQTLSEDDTATVTYTCSKEPVVPGSATAAQAPSNPAEAPDDLTATAPAATCVELSAPTPPGTTVFLYARFDDANGAPPWPNSTSEVSAMVEGRWDPWTDVFKEVVEYDWKTLKAKGLPVDESPWICESFLDFAGALTGSEAKPRKENSVGRIYLVTHGRPGLVAFSGFLDVQPTNTDVYLGRLSPTEIARSNEESRRIDDELLLWLNGSDGTGPAYRDKIRKVLRGDAALVIVSCRAGKGMGSLDMKRLADTLMLDVYAFSEEVRYEPTFYAPDQIVHRDRTLYPKCSPAPERGCMHLVPDMRIPKPGP